MSERPKSFTVVVNYNGAESVTVFNVVSTVRGRGDWLEIKCENGTEITIRPTWDSFVQCAPGIGPEASLSLFETRP